jgi:hypothetical protein
MIEEKIGFGLAIVYPDKHCARRINVAPLREMFHATGATKPQRSPGLFITGRIWYQ